MTEDVLSYDEAARLAGKDRRTVRRWVADGLVDKEPTGKLLPNGHRQMGVPRESLERYLGQCAAIPPGPARPEAPAPAGTQPVSFALPSGAPRQLELIRQKLPAHIPITRDGLPDTAAMRSMGLERQADEWDRDMQIVSEFQQALADAPHGRKRAAARRVASRHGVSVRSLYRKSRLLREGGPSALVKAWGETRGFSGYPRLLQKRIIEAFLATRMSKTQVHRQVVVPWYAQDGKACPHRTTTFHFIREHVKPLAETFFRDGRRAYEANAKPKVIRDLPPVGEVWCADHRLWDVQVIVADGRGAGWGKYGTKSCPCGSGRLRRDCCSVARPWVTMIADVGSAAWVGWRIGRTPNAAGICHALRSALLGYGVPRKWYRDNGRDFCARRLGGEPERLRNPRRKDVGYRTRWPAAMPERVEASGIFVHLGVKLLTALPFNPWSKPVESYFRAFGQQWEELVPGYCGRNTDNKPEELDPLIGKGLLMTWDEFPRIFAEQAAAWNRTHVCGEREKPPLALYKDARASGEITPPPSADTLSFLIQDARQGVKVTTKGLVLGGRAYMSEALALYIGQKMPEVRWDPEEPKWAFVTTPDDRTLAVPPAGKAGWDGFDGVNERRKREARAQRQYLSDLKDSVFGSCSLAQLDPTGAYRMVAERKAVEAQQAQQQQLAIGAAREEEEPPTPNVYEEADDEFRQQFGT